MLVFNIIVVVKLLCDYYCYCYCVIVICTVFLQVYSICMTTEFNQSLIYIRVVACVYTNSDL